MRKQTALWTCKDKSRVRICDMTDSHLRNAISLLERRAEEFLSLELRSAYSVLSSLQGEMAQFCCEQDIDRMEETTSQEYLADHYQKLCDEWERRGFKEEAA